jgi:hypothetical protein
MSSDVGKSMEQQKPHVHKLAVSARAVVELQASRETEAHSNAELSAN